MKTKIHTVHSDFKTGILCKLFIILGIIFIISALVLRFGNLVAATLYEAILAFGILFVGLGVILYFFHCQFKKLSDIADELEKYECEDDETVDTTQ